MSRCDGCGMSFSAYLTPSSTQAARWCSPRTDGGLLRECGEAATTMGCWRNRYVVSWLTTTGKVSDTKTTATPPIMVSPWLRRHGPAGSSKHSRQCVLWLTKRRLGTTIRTLSPAAKMTESDAGHRELAGPTVVQRKATHMTGKRHSDNGDISRRQIRSVVRRKVAAPHHR